MFTFPGLVRRTDSVLHPASVSRLQGGGGGVRGNLGGQAVIIRGVQSSSSSDCKEKKTSFLKLSRDPA